MNQKNRLYSMFAISALMGLPASTAHAGSDCDLVYSGNVPLETMAADLINPASDLNLDDALVACLQPNTVVLGTGDIPSGTFHANNLRFIMLNGALAQVSRFEIRGLPNTEGGLTPIIQDDRLNMINGGLSAEMTFRVVEADAIFTNLKITTAGMTVSPIILAENSSIDLSQVDIRTTGSNVAAIRNWPNIPPGRSPKSVRMEEVRITTEGDFYFDQAMIISNPTTSVPLQIDLKKVTASHMIIGTAIVQMDQVTLGRVGLFDVNLPLIERSSFEQLRLSGVDGQTIQNVQIRFVADSPLGSNGLSLLSSSVDLIDGLLVRTTVAGNYMNRAISLEDSQVNTIKRIRILPENGAEIESGVLLDEVSTLQLLKNAMIVANYCAQGNILSQIDVSCQ